MATDSSDTPPDILTDSLRKQLNAEAEKQFRKSNPAGGLAAVVRDGNVEWEFPYGVADLESSQPFDSNTVFRIASITKTFSATAIFQLRDAGKLELDDPVSKFIPEIGESSAIKAAEKPISLRHLLSHRSGLGGAIPVDWPYYTEKRSPTRDEALATLSGLAPINEPEKLVRYSNFGFALLGEVVRRVSGTDCEAYIVEEICKPLGLDSTRFSLTDEMRSRFATGYKRSDVTSNVEPAERVDLQFDSPAGGMYSTAADLAKWADFHLSSDESPVLSVSSRKEMRKPQFLTPDWSNGVCMNWFGRKVGDVVMFGHGGGLPGYMSEFMFVPAHGFGVISFVNTAPPGIEVADKIVEMVSEALKESDDPAGAEPVRLATKPPDDMAKYLGLYMFDDGMTVWFEWWNDSLRARDNNISEAGPTTAVFKPTDEPGVFTADAPPFNRDKLVFQESESGEVAGFVFEAAFVRKLT